MAADPLHMPERPPSAAPLISDPRPILTSIGVVVYDWDLGSDRIAWGANVDEVLGLGDASGWTSGREFAERVENIGASRHDVIAASSTQDDGTGVPFLARYGLRVAPGRMLQIEESGRWFADATGRPARAHGIMRARPTDGDTLPGFRQRDALFRMLASYLSEGRKSGSPVSIAAVSLENLTEINEEFGYEQADDVLASVAERLWRHSRQQDRSIRYGGNRFAVLLRGCGIGEIQAAAARLAREVEAQPVETPAGPVTVKLVMGAATAPDHAPNASSLFHRAEEALGLAKKRSGDRFVLYDAAALRARPRTRTRKLVRECQDFLKSRRIAFACQPVVEAKSRRTVFHETLLRSSDENGQIVVAADIVPSFERAGLVHLADARMLELVTAHLAAKPELRLAINVSPITLEHAEWLDLLGARLADLPGIAPRLIVEVTETAAIRNPRETGRQLEQMKALGVSIAIDDFGAGHTSFRYLREFPVDYLKIDGAFVQDLPRRPSDGFFVRTLIDLAGHLGIATVAEWVEDEETAQRLAAWGIDFLQGDLIGPPVIVGRAELDPHLVPV